MVGYARWRGSVALNLGGIERRVVDSEGPMPEGKAHQVWIEQCEAAQTIRARFGLKAAFDYLVGERLLNFAETAINHANFAQELPRFVSEVRRMFKPEEIEAELAGNEQVHNNKPLTILMRRILFGGARLQPRSASAGSI